MFQHRWETCFLSSGNRLILKIPPEYIRKPGEFEMFSGGTESSISEIKAFL